MRRHTVVFALALMSASSAAVAAPNQSMETAALEAVQAAQIDNILPAPILDGPLKQGDTELKGRFAIGNKNPQIRFYVDGVPVTNHSVLLDERRGEFIVELGPLAEPGEAAKKLTAKLVVAGMESAPSNEVQTLVRPAPKTATIQDIEVDAALANALILFQADDSAAGSVVAVVKSKTIQTCEYGRKTLSADDVKVGEIVVELKADASKCSNEGKRKILSVDDLMATLEVPRQAGGNTPLSTFIVPDIVGAGAWVQMVEPLKEGESKIQGKAGSQYKRVFIAVLAGEYSVKGTSESRLKPQATTQADQTGVNHPPRKSAHVGEAEHDSTGQSPVRFGALAAQSHLEEMFASGDSQAVRVAREIRGNLYREILEEQWIDTKDGGFSLTLAQSPIAGSRVVVCPVITTKTWGDVVKTPFGCSETIVESVGIDFGRFRAFFATGAETSSSNGFTNTAPFLSFYGDVSVMNGLLHPRRNPTGLDDSLGLGWFGISLHSFVEARLSQAPQDKTGSQGASLFQFGIYAPVRVGGMEWVHHGQQYSSYFAPLAKFGATVLPSGTASLGGAASGQQTCASCASTATTASSGTGPVAFHGLGLRLGIMKYDMIGSVVRNRQIAPDPILYVDATIGQNGVYQRTVTADSQTATHTGTVFQFEGRMRIPFVPVLVGLDYARLWSRPQQGSSELRFIGALRIDVGKALSKVFPNLGK